MDIKSTMGKIVNIVGSTGLTGRELLKQLIENSQVETIRVFARRASGLQHPKLEEHLIDFDHPEEWQHLVTGDILFSALGTTLKQAGSKNAQYRVDYTYQYLFAQIAAKNGIPVYALVSSVGADPKSPFFYARMKGELDRAVGKLPFEKCIILRPSILTGDREKKRPMENITNKVMNLLSKLVFKKYRPVAGSVVAAAMIYAAFDKTQKGLTLAEADELFILANQ